jgi:hypothetical protein
VHETRSGCRGPLLIIIDGDGMMFLRDVQSKTDIELKVRDSYIREMRNLNQQGKKLKVVLDGRVSEIQ